MSNPLATTYLGLELSSAMDQRLPLRWIGLLHGRLPLVGGQITQVVAALLRHGPGQLRQIQAELIGWLEQQDYSGLDALRGCLSQARCPDPEVFERAQYLRALSSYGGPLW